MFRDLNLSNIRQEVKLRMERVCLNDRCRRRLSRGNRDKDNQEYLERMICKLGLC